VADSPEEAAELVNRFAPEHLLIHTASPFDTLGMIRNAGEILLGSDIPFSGANYAAGPNAVLPTGGFARSYSPVSVRDFIKYSSVIFATGRGFRTLEPRVTAIADYEGFHTHAMAYRIRGESPNETSGSGERRPEQYTP
jgi:histidinol dehydrogenase